MKDKIDGGCCGGTPFEGDFENCMPYRGFERLLPTGATGRDGVIVLFRNIYGKEMTRQQFYNWTAQEGRGIDPVEVMTERLKASGLLDQALAEPLLRD